ncbi:hypothetical protein [Streptomyces sp. NPDC050485]
MNAEAALRELEDMFTTSAQTVEPTAEARNRKPSGEGDQRTTED